MTDKLFNKKRTSAILTITVITLTFILTMLFSEKIAHSVKSGLSLCANVIIPSVFPFIILSDMLYSYIDFTSIGFIGKTFEKIFKINRCGLYPFMLGILCGFPLGVKCASEIYREGYITKDEAERLIGFSNNTGPAFLVCGIGIGLRGKFYDGILLYAVMVFSSVLCGIIFSFGKKCENHESYKFKTRPFKITESIKNAGTNTLNICSYLTFFACIVGLLRNTIGESFLYLTLIPFLEVGSSASILSKTKLLSSIGSITLTSFAVAFSGFSVHLQALSFISDTDLSTKRYFLMKFVQGILSVIIIYPIYLLFFN